VRFEVLGFAGAAPLHGACPSYLLSGGDRTVLLDCGPGALERLWRRSLLGRLDAIVVSHMHADHMLDLVIMAGELVRSLSADRRPPLYVPAGDGRTVLAGLDAAFSRSPSARTRFDEAFDVIDYDDSDTVEIGALELTFAATEHAQPCYAARASDGRATFVYGADGAPGQAIEQLAAGADLLVLEATFLDDERAAAEARHMTASQAGALASRAGASRLLLTHRFPDADAALLARAAALAFAGEVDVAHEGYVYEMAS
jgi:ribonuclease BN (tRNA processing enzyme)